MQFTGRAVLAPGYDLKLGQVGLPAGIAWALFCPLVVGKVGADAVRSRSEEARRAVERLMEGSIVIINRAPTWEPTCITAFTPVMAPDLCIRLHPLCCRLFNGDFDGDQAAVWLPISEPAQREAKEKLTLAGHLRRDPSVVVMHLTPSHAVLAGLAYALESTEGRREFDAMWPAGSKPPAPPLTRADLAMRLLEVLEIHGAEVLLNLLDSLYTFGIAQATKSGASFSPFAGEGLRLPPPPASDASPSWDAYRSLLDSAIMSSADADPTMKAPMRALRCGARGSVAALRATLGPWAVSGPFDVGGPIRHGFRDGLTAEELWLWASRARAALQDIHRSQVELAKTSRFTGDLTVLRRAMSSDDPGKVFAEAAEIGESEPLTDPDVRLWAGLLPSATGNSQSE
jgi:DNA-directed RNA polymerase beta' subunit